MRYVPKQSIRSTLNTSYIRFGHVQSMYRSSPFRSILNTGYITGLDMCALCTEAVHSVALWTRVYITGLDMCALCTEADHSVALWTRVTLGLDMWKVCTEAVHSVAFWTWTASVHTLHMSKPNVTRVQSATNGLLRYIAHTCPNLM